MIKAPQVVTIFHYSPSRRVYVLFSFSLPYWSWPSAASFKVLYLLSFSSRFEPGTAWISNIHLKSTLFLLLSNKPSFAYSPYSAGTLTRRRKRSSSGSPTYSLAGPAPINPAKTLFIGVELDRRNLKIYYCTNHCSYSDGHSYRAHPLVSTCSGCRGRKKSLVIRRISGWLVSQVVSVRGNPKRKCYEIEPLVPTWIPVWKTNSDPSQDGPSYPFPHLSYFIANKPSHFGQWKTSIGLRYRACPSI